MALRCRSTALILIPVLVPTAADRENLGSLAEAGGCEDHSSGAEVNPRESCSRCVDAKCKWCPLAQTCYSTGLFSSGCAGRRGFDEDVEVKEAQICESHAPWARALEDTLGIEWSPEALARHEDGRRCVHGMFGWHVERKPSDGKKDDEELVGWGCQSMLLRLGTLMLMDLIDAGYTLLQTQSREVVKLSSNLGRRGRERKPLGQSLMLLGERVGSAANASKSALRESWEHNSGYYVPTLCTISYEMRKGELCNVLLFGREEMKLLRSATSSPNAASGQSLDLQLAEAVQEGPLVPLTPGAGKSGSGFAQVRNGRFMFKLGVRSSVGMDEIENLINIVHGLEGTPEARPLEDHLMEHPESLLNRIYGSMRLGYGLENSWVLILGNAFYGVDARAAAAKEKDDRVRFYRYDLKGASRKQDERAKSITDFALSNGDFKELEDDRMQLTIDQCRYLLDAVASDTNYLDAHSLIDYSFAILSVQKPPGATDIDISCANTPGEPFCFEHKDRVYTISIIDYLNNFNAAKQAENLLRAGKFDNYGQKMVDFIEHVCPTGSHG